jgi:polynucleotide 5'-hydroxyl-kinase GRC3/NOL9
MNDSIDPESTGIPEVESWHRALVLILEAKGSVILIGSSDSGKTTLARFLISQLCRRAIKTALVDADTGQSFIGPPTTIGLAFFRGPFSLERAPVPEIFFVGTTSPAGNLALHLKGVEWMMRRAIQHDPEVVLIDITGLVSGDLGRFLKIRKIEITRPGIVLALQRSSELEGILDPFDHDDSIRIVRLPVSGEVRLRSPEERAAYRRSKFRAYFRGARVRTARVGRLQFEGKVSDSMELALSPEEALGVSGLLVGLLDIRGDTLALGLTRGLREDRTLLRVWTPLRVTTRAAAAIRLSSLRLTDSFEEERL